MITKYEIGFWLLILIAAFFVYIAYRREYRRKTNIMMENYRKVWKKYYDFEDKKKKE